MMHRRTLMRGLSAASAMWPVATHAQSPRKLARIGVLTNAPSEASSGPQPASPSIRAFIASLAELGLKYGEHYVIEARGSGGQPERFGALVAELLASKVDIVVGTGNAMTPLKQATSTIPIVMAAHSDPVGAGLVQSLARPGGNITGLSLQHVELVGKRLELLTELAPTAKLIAVVWDRPGKRMREAAEDAAKPRSWSLLPLEMTPGKTIENLVQQAVAARADAVLTAAPGTLFPRSAEVAAAIGRAKLPAMYDFRVFVEAGGLVSYGADIIAIWQRAAAYVDKILKGAKPADLPVEQPTKFELIVNAATAKALGLTIPASILVQATEVLE